jgi:pimeloyl-ACP methyl ester carboxylesterase
MAGRHSWGSTLAANYVLRHPDRVERVVFLSPGPPWYPEYPNFEFKMKDASRPLIGEERTQRDRARQPTARIATGRALGEFNPRLGTALIPDREVDQWMALAWRLSSRLGQDRMFCPDDP